MAATIGSKIKKARHRRGLTQDLLAKRGNLPYTTLAKIESDVITKPTIQTVAKIARGLGMGIDELLR